MGSVPARPKSREPVALHAHAMDNLRFIRETMESAGSFTAVPGMGGILMGLSALAAAFLAGRQAGMDGWLAVWMGEAIVAVLIGVVAAAQKARAGKAALLTGPGRKFALGLAPSIFVAALLHQYALVEVAASIVTGLQVFFLSSAVGDLLEEKKEANRARNSVVVLVTVFLAAFYTFTRYFH